MKTLYKKAKTGKIQVHSMWTVGPIIYSEYGTHNGKMQVSSVVAEPKNVGKANETTASEQAILEMNSKLQNKRDKGYFDTIEEAENQIVFLPMLAKDGTKVKITYPCYGQPKLDGVRCMANTDGSLMSRGGKDYDVAHITEKIKAADVPYVLDGELYIPSTPLQDIVSFVKKPKEGSEKIQYWIYDMYVPDIIWEERMKLLATLEVYGISLVEVPSVLINSEEEMKAFHDKCVEEGFEGVILRHPEGKYELNKRSRYLIKYKEMKDSEYKIIDVIEGKGKFVGCAIFVCENPDGPNFNVTPKGNMKQKREWFQDRENLIGKHLTVQYQALTKANVPQFPVGIAIRDYE